MLLKMIFVIFIAFFTTSCATVNERGFDVETKIHTKTNTNYDHGGYDFYGYDKDGYDRDGFDKLGFNKDGYDRDGP